MLPATPQPPLTRKHPSSLRVSDQFKLITLYKAGLQDKNVKTIQTLKNLPKKSQSLTLSLNEQISIIYFKHFRSKLLLTTWSQIKYSQ